MANENLGLIGRKLGMTQIFAANGVCTGVTVVELSPNTVLQVKSTEGVDGYNALQMGAGVGKEKQTTKAELGHFAKAGAGVCKVVREFRVNGETAAKHAVGSQLSVGDLFKDGQFVDVQGVSKGKGYQGVMRRHNFSGFKASHGVHEYYRHGGSIGTRLTPGMTMAGMKMPGHMGDRTVSVQNLKIVKIDAERNLVYLKGGVPGADGASIIVRPAVKLQG
jgi:large subunit ribosomal protein L3